jgi:hypothetical protein
MLAEACAAPACKLTCVFLNACLTLPLALEVLRQLPQLQLICWATIAEDSAARYFSSGFADSIGEALEQADGTRSATDRGPDVRRAFQRGCEVFRSVGCNFGDPVRARGRRRCGCVCCSSALCALAQAEPLRALAPTPLSTATATLP